MKIMEMKTEVQPIITEAEKVSENHPTIKEGQPIVETEEIPEGDHLITEEEIQITTRTRMITKMSNIPMTDDEFSNVECRSNTNANKRADIDR